MNTATLQPMFAITAKCLHQQTSLTGLRVRLWTGRTLAAARAAMKRLQTELGSGYSEFEIIRVVSRVS